MKVLCQYDKDSAVPIHTRNNDFTAETSFPVTIGNTYNVYSMGQRIGSPLLEYLVTDELGYPFFCPSNLFVVVDSTLPSHWGYAEWVQQNFQYRIWGYSEILNYKHNEGVMERNKEDMEIFTRERKRIDDCSWIAGEKQVLNKLISINNFSDLTNPVLIEKREHSGNFLRTFYYGSSQLFCSNEKSNANKTISVTVNDEKYEGICSLMVKKGNICGMELFMLEGDLPIPTQKIEISSSETSEFCHEGKKNIKFDDLKG